MDCIILPHWPLSCPHRSCCMLTRTDRDTRLMEKISTGFGGADCGSHHPTSLNQPCLTCSSFISFSARSLSAVSASSSWEVDSPVLRSSVSSDVSSEIWGVGEGVSDS